MRLICKYKGGCCSLLYALGILVAVRGGGVF